MRKLLICLLCLITAVPCSGESVLLSSDILFAELTSIESHDGQAVVTMTLVNRTEGSLDICLLNPTLNGVPAWFDRDQVSLTMTVPARETQTVCVTVDADDPDEVPETVSFQFLTGGEITLETVVTLPDGAVRPAVPVPEEERVMLSAAGMPEQDTAPVLLEDALLADDLERLDYGQAQVCARSGDWLKVLATLPADVDASGHVTAQFSGMILALDGDDPFPITSRETWSDGRIHWRTDRISLYSEAIYFCQLLADVTMTPGEGAATAVTLTAEEFGTAVNAPYRLFEDGSASALLCRPGTDPQDDTAQVDAVFERLHITGPLRLSLLPAHEAGELVYYFEYFFQDAESVTHAIHPIPEPGKAP